MSNTAWIQTYAPKQFFPLDPRPEDVDIEDIANSLSYTCRFRGHTDCFYSVAQHCCYVAQLLPDNIGVYGLLHDAAEAYLFDCPTPIKFAFPGIIKAEKAIMAVIYERFGILPPTPEIEEQVKDFDTRLLITERRDFMKKPPASWNVEVTPLDRPLTAWRSEEAKRCFLKLWECYQKLMGL